MHEVLDFVGHIALCALLCTGIHIVFHKRKDHHSEQEIVDKVLLALQKRNKIPGRDADPFKDPRRTTKCCGG